MISAQLELSEGSEPRTRTFVQLEDSPPILRNLDKVFRTDPQAAEINRMAMEVWGLYLERRVRQEMGGMCIWRCVFCPYWRGGAGRSKMCGPQAGSRGW